MGKTKHNDDWFDRERLHRAAEEGDLPEVERLVSMGSAFERFDDISFTPLHYAVRGEQYKVAQLLLSKGADVNAHESEKAGDTPLAEATRGKCPEMVELLLKNGADPDVPAASAGRRDIRRAHDDDLSHAGALHGGRRNRRVGDLDPRNAGQAGGGGTGEHATFVAGERDR